MTQSSFSEFQLGFDCRRALHWKERQGGDLTPPSLPHLSERQTGHDAPRGALRRSRGTVALRRSVEAAGSCIRAAGEQEMMLISAASDFFFFHLQAL